MLAIRWLLILTLLAGAVPTVRAANSSRVSEEWMAGYIKLDEGGKAEEAGRLAAALDLYREALVTFREVQRKYPAWNPSLMTYRITFCEKRIERLEKTVGEQTAEMGKADLEVVVRNQVTKIHELAGANAALKTELAEARESLERARLEAARSVNQNINVQDLVGERKELQDKLLATVAENRRLAEELRTIQEKGGLKAQADRLQVELDQARVKQAELEEARETYKKAWINVKNRLQEALDTRERDIEFVRKLRDRALLAENRAEASAKALEQAQNEWQKLKIAKEQAELDAKAQEQEAAAAQARLEPLRKENEQLRAFRDQALAKTSQAAELEKQIRTLAAEKAEALAQAEGLRTDAERSIAANADLQKQLAEARAAAAEAGKGTAAVADLEKKLAEAQAALAESEKARKLLVAQTTTGAPDTGAEGQELAAAKEEARRATAEKERLETQLAEAKRNAADKALLEAQLAEAKQDVVAKELLEAQLAEAKRKLTAAEGIVADQKRLLATSSGRAEDLATLGAQLKEREEGLAAAQKEMTELRGKLSTAEKEMARSEEVARASSFEATRLRTRLEAAEKQLKQLDEQLAAEHRTRKVAGEEAMVERLDQAAKVVKDLEREGEELKAKTKEQLKMLRDQEKSIGKLEEEKQELAKEIERRDQQIEKLKLEAEFVAEKSQASAGLVASLGDTDKQLAEAKRQLVAMLGERDRAREEAQDLRARLTTARTELTKTRDLLSEQATPGAAGKLLREQIRQLEIQLEKESQKRRLLEELLSKGETLATTPAATATDVPRPLPQAADRVEVYEGATFPEAAEREKRAAQRQLLARGFLRQGVAAEKEGNVEAARWNYGKVLENDPDNHTATQRLGLIAAELKQDKEAIRYLKRAFRLDPDNRDILLPLGFALVRQSEPDLAVSMLSRAVALEPDNADAHRYLGVACSTLGWYGAAEVQFRRTFELNPDDADNAFNLAALLATREPPRLEEAKTWYLRARKLGAAAEPGLDQMFGLTGEAGE